jgi:hypothetical protein
MLHDILTPHGVNAYVLMLQQLHNWDIHWHFMDHWLPSSMVRYHTVRYVMHWHDISEYPTHPQMVNMPMLFELHTPLRTPWVESEDAPADAFFHHLVTGTMTYSVIQHMVHLYHGRIPTSDHHRVFRWLRRSRLFRARSVLLPRVGHREDIVDRILQDCIAAEVCNIWRTLDWPLR